MSDSHEKLESLQAGAGIRVAISATRTVTAGAVALLVSGGALTATRAIPSGYQTASPAPARGLLVGKVVDATTNLPVADAVVALSLVTRAPRARGAPQADSQRALTDESGRFLFREVGDGRYTLAATAFDYLPGGFGQLRPDGPQQPIEQTNRRSPIRSRYPFVEAGIDQRNRARRDAGARRQHICAYLSAQPRWRTPQMEL
jgi:hypothetical protein